MSEVTEAVMEVTEAPVVTPETTEAETPEVVEATPMPIPAAITGTGVALGLWRDTALVVPQLRDDMTLTERRDTIREILKKSVDAEDRLDLVTGELLYECNKNQYWKEWTFTDNSGETRKFSNFDEWADCDLKINYRKAIYLVGIYEKYVVELDLDRETLKGISWSKAKELVKVVNKDNCKTLLTQMRGMTVKQCTELAKTLRKGSSEPLGSEAKNVAFKLFPEQINNVEAAIEVAKRLAATDKNGAALDYICSDFIAGVPAGSGLEATLENLQKSIKSLERVYNVTLELQLTEDQKKFYGVRAATE